MLRGWVLIGLALLLGSACGRETNPGPARAAIVSAPTPSASAAPAELPRPADPWPGPRGRYWFREAEGFTVEGGAWKPLATRPGPRSRGWASGGMALDGRQPGAGFAKIELDGLQAGRYALWIRVQGVRGASGDAAATRAIAVHVTQSNVSKLESSVVSDEGLPTTSASDFVWKRLEVELTAGSLEVSLGKQGVEHTGLRVVDCLLLTEDLAYTPDVRDFHPQLYARLRASASSNAPVTLDNGLTTPRLARGALFDPVAPGASSPWRNVTRWWEGAAELSLPLIARSRTKTDRCVLDFASVPDEAHLKKSIELEVAAGLTHVVLPVTLETEVPRASPELARARVERISRLPAVAFGRRPTRFPILIDLRSDSSAEPWEKQAAAYVGVNGFTGPLSSDDIAGGFAFNRVYNAAFYFGPGGYADVKWGEMARDLERDGARYASDPNWPRAQHLKLIDEAQAPALERLAGEPHAEAAFRAWLGRQSAAAGIPPSQRRLVASRDGDPRLYYLSQRFRAWLVADFFRGATKLAHRAYPAGAKTTQNMSDGAVIYANLYAQGNDYFEYFGSGALDVALSEDWTNSGATRQLCGWNVALLRSATKYRHQPIHMYVIAYSGRRPFEAKLKALSDIAQGAKLLDLYSYTPQYLGGEIGWAESLPIIGAMAELTREIGAAEDVLMDAMPTKAKVALLYSIPADIWATGHDVSHGNERMLTYLALRHAQLPTDVLTDTDVTRGGLSGYEVAYLNDVELPRPAARALVDWVSAGGTLVLGVDAGSRDELSRSDGWLSSALGLRRLPSRGAPSTLPTGNFDELPPDVAQVTLGTKRFGAPLWAQTFDETSSQGVVARFDDGSPAVVQRRVGKGKVVAFGFLAATSYMRDALVARKRAGGGEQIAPPSALERAFWIALPAPSSVSRGPVLVTESDVWGTLPSAYPTELRALLTEPARGTTAAVAADSPLVETTLLEGSQGFVVPLANYGGKALDRVRITIRPSRRALGISSSRRGELRTEPAPSGGISVELPLESTDFVFGAWAP